MSSSLLGLPPVPAGLKPISSFLQRADELAKQDKIVSYWCTYYAAQVGISLKARDAPSRDFLMNLLDLLEQMKSAIGSHDAIDVETVSAAYVENFALKVFANADNEDRRGGVTRSTAKKFLAASNFLEVLKVFPKRDVSEANEEKIKYSKWKAADIAKAFREGRKPAPGPPGWAEEQEELRRVLQEQVDSQNSPEITTLPTVPSGPTSSSPPRSSHVDESTPRHSPSRRSPTSSSPSKPTHIHVDRSLNGWNNGPADSPETWSNAATPGGDPPNTAASVYTIGSVTPSTAGYSFQHPDSPTRSAARSGPAIPTTKPRSGSGSSSNTISSTGSKGVLKKSSSKTPSPDSDKRVHFSPSTVGTPAEPPHTQLPSSSSSGSPTRHQYTGPDSIYAPSAPPNVPIPPLHAAYPSQTSPTSHYPSAAPPPPSSSSPPRQNYIYGPPKQASPVRYAPPPPPPPPAPVEVELTPALISKVQRHCRFAISSLDYEDAEQARKELRAALALLDG
ncbi:hypothetical protein D9619_002836 [Psilocybe cf. subviscida]|uniref:DUF605-domain-containing protein n=1 Tax=Psilocybe cf. subviscida TaxID=2480587 RepID=A0A8H5AW52_9AGAR|nr:hypothetical protein D9619_002836 [Psilocybe cf. subviscida]